MGLNDLITYMIIEKDNIDLGFEKRTMIDYLMNKANKVEHTHKTNNRKHNRATFSNDPNGGGGDNKEFKRILFVYNNTTRNSLNTNSITDEIIMLVICGHNYRQNIQN